MPWLSELFMELNPSDRGEGEVHRGRAYTEYKERFVKLTKESLI